MFFIPLRDKFDIDTLCCSILYLKLTNVPAFYRFQRHVLTERTTTLKMIFAFA